MNEAKLLVRIFGKRVIHEQENKNKRSRFKPCAKAYN